MKRAEYVESELKKWKEMFEIDYINEYDVKLLLSLRHQLEETPDEKIKTKVDLINAIKNLSRDLKLKPKTVEQKEKTEILILVDTYNEAPETANVIVKLLGKDQITKKIITNNYGHIETKNHSIKIRPISENIRGARSRNYTVKLKSVRDVYEVLNK